jgi:hypothetical protein
MNSLGVCRNLIDARHLGEDVIRRDNSWDFALEKFRLARSSTATCR